MKEGDFKAIQRLVFIHIKRLTHLKGDSKEVYIDILKGKANMVQEDHEGSANFVSFVQEDNIIIDDIL